MEVESLRSSMIFKLQTRTVTPDQLREMLRNNLRHAVRWIETAANGGITTAQLVLGQLLLDGHGVSRDANAAFSWFTMAAKSGDIEARNMMGRCYEQGWGVEVDFRRATECFEICAQAHHLWGQVNLAQMLMRSGDPADRPRCFALFEGAAKRGTGKAALKAMNSLARFLEEGWAGKPDPDGAAFWYLRAAHLGDHWAQYNLATILFAQGECCKADELLKSAVSVSDNGFRRRIAPLLLSRPEPMLRRHGRDALAYCAADGDTEDLYAYGLALDEEITGVGDPLEAARCFKEAAAKGHVQAAARLRFTQPTKNNLSSKVRTVVRRFMSPTLVRSEGM